MRKNLLLYLKGLLMGAADIVPGVSGGTMALITGIYSELIESIDNLRLEQLKLLKKKGWKPFWKEINGPFLLPLIFGVISGILFLSGGITFLLERQPILLWSFFFGLILASIFILFNQLKERKWGHFFLLFVGFLVAFGITLLTPTASSNNLVYLFFSSMIAIIAMILPGISGAFIFILLGVYEEVLQTVKGSVAVLLNFSWSEFQTVYTKVVVIALGIFTGLKVFSRVLTWLFTHQKEATLSVLIGFMMGALPKIWPWKTTIETAHKTSWTNVNPLELGADAQFIPAFLLLISGALSMILIERYAPKK